MTLVISSFWYNKNFVMQNLLRRIGHFGYGMMEFAPSTITL